MLFLLLQSLFIMVLFVFDRVVVVVGVCYYDVTTGVRVVVVDVTAVVVGIIIVVGAIGACVGVAVVVVFTVAVVVVVYCRVACVGVCVVLLLVGFMLFFWLFAAVAVAVGSYVVGVEVATCVTWLCCRCVRLLCCLRCCC